MRYIGFLLIIYITLLAIMPCMDKDDFACLPGTNTTIQNKHLADDQALKETCTPFCTCSCCSTVRNLTPLAYTTTLFVQPVVRTYAQATVPALHEQSIAIWQPPQSV